MPQKTASRLRDLLKELERAQNESGDLAIQARQEIAGLMGGGDVKPVGTSGSSRRKKKAGKKKR